MISITGSGFISTSNQLFPTQSILTEDVQGGWTRQDDTGGGTVYFGFSGIGASENAAVWKIRREVTSGGNVTITYADGDANFDNIWANRGSLNYL